MNQQLNPEIRRHLFLDRTRRRIDAGTYLVVVIALSAVTLGLNLMYWGS